MKRLILPVILLALVYNWISPAHEHATGHKATAVTTNTPKYATYDECYKDPNPTVKQCQALFPNAAPDTTPIPVPSRRQLRLARRARRTHFLGDGTFLVGPDIEPGTYRAAAMPGCYWARLRSLDTSDIIDNNNTDGPVVLGVLPSDNAVEVSGCSEFRKIR